MSIPRLTRSALHRCPVRPGISRLLRDDEHASGRGSSGETRIGYVRVDHGGPPLARGKPHMLPHRKS